MKVLSKIELMGATLANLAIFACFAAMFVMIFFFPETAGSIAGKIARGFHQSLNEVHSVIIK